jgi:DNA-binding winged helix-turn-helix (wHTH) protein/cytochrome c-type biogenesis protein CcmH/NrfG
VAARPLYSFGPFQLDAGAHRLTHGGSVLTVPARHLDVLAALVARAGTVVSKDVLVEAAWRDVAVTDNSLEQAVSVLRRALGRAPGGESYIQTVPRQGYRFVADVRTEAARASDAELESLIAPYRAWVEGRAALESLDAGRIASARAAFEAVLRASPADAIAHVGLANACVMRFEATRAEASPDIAALSEAASHAREACRLDPRSGEAWATNGFVLDRTGNGTDAMAALGRAVSLEPDNWRHYFRLSLVSWGEARLRGARRTLALLPGLPLAHWLAATVHVARQNLDEAEAELRAGLDSMRAAPGGDGSRFPGVALEWLRGLIELARGAEDAALACFERELALENQNHLYGRECCANVWYAIGAVHLRRGHRSDAAHAFRETLDRVPRHAAAVALAAGAITPGGTAVVRGVSSNAGVVDKALAQAIARVMAGDNAGAAAAMASALANCEPGSHAWWLPVEPMLGVAAQPEIWAPVLAQLRSRAS